MLPAQVQVSKHALQRWRDRVPGQEMACEADVIRIFIAAKHVPAIKAMRLLGVQTGDREIRYSEEHHCYFLAGQEWRPSLLKKPCWRFWIITVFLQRWAKIQTAKAVNSKKEWRRNKKRKG